MIATYVAIAAVCAFALRRIFSAIRQPVDTAACFRTFDKPSDYAFGVLVGALIANAIPHFVHGVSGEHFPAPFSYAFGKSYGTNISNVLWGVFNFGAGWVIASDFRGTPRRRLFLALATFGFVATSLFLSTVFTHSASR